MEGKLVKDNKCFSDPNFDGLKEEITNEIAETIPTKISDLENDSSFVTMTEVNTKVEEVNKTVTEVSETTYIKTEASDITIEAHTVNWNGGQVYLGNKRVDSTNTITKEGYYPIGVVNVTANSTDKYYLLRGHSSKKEGSVNVTYCYYANGNETIAPNDMPTATILVAWVKVRTV